jgi:hypothetical protein
MMVLGHGILLVGKVLIALTLPPEALPALLFKYFWLKLTPMGLALSLQQGYLAPDSWWKISKFKVC